MDAYNLLTTIQYYAILLVQFLLWYSLRRIKIACLMRVLGLTSISS